MFLIRAMKGVRQQWKKLQATQRVGFPVKSKRVRLVSLIAKTIYFVSKILTLGGFKENRKMTIELQTAMQVKLWKPGCQVSQNDVIIMATDGMWDVVSNQVKEAAKKSIFF